MLNGPLQDEGVVTGSAGPRSRPVSSSMGTRQRFMLPLRLLA